MEKRSWIALILLISCSVPAVTFDNVSFSVEVAQTQQEKARGLMFRESMPDNHGMLFVFDKSGPLSFWMKNTLIPLDMVFIDGNMTVVDVKTAVPCKADPCASYKSSGMYVLEINAGLAEKYGIKNGSVMSRN
ncbi:putative ACR [uncultured archaeon]|nr:putative ACR [uncultured archaeon]